MTCQRVTLARQSHYHRDKFASTKLSMRAIAIAAASVLLIVGSFSLGSTPDQTVAAFIVPAGPQSIPDDSGIEETRSGCDNNTGHQLCRDGADSPSCGY